MTEEAREQTFALYLDATKALESIRRRERFGEEEGFATTPTSSAARSIKFIIRSDTPLTPFNIRRSGSTATQQTPPSEDESVEEIIWRAGTTLPVPYKRKVASRLNELQKAVQEEESNSCGITAKSLQSFVEFLKSHPTFRYPAISVTPDRNIYASWRSGTNRIFSVHFLPDGKIRFIIICPNDKLTGETIRISGSATLDIVMKVIEPYGVLAWARE
jgi:hypothetical protein